MSWEPLHSGNPFPADAEGIGTYGDAVHDTGVLIVEQISLLRRLGDRDSWKTDTAEAFREKAEELADAISKAKDRYLETGAALKTLSYELRWHEQQAEIHRSEAETLAPIAGRDEAKPTPGEDGEPGELTPEQEASNSARTAAITRLSELQCLFNGIVSRAEEDADTAESKINRAKDDDVKDGFWEKHAGWIRTVAGVIAVIAAVVLLTVATGGLIWVVAMVVAIGAGLLALTMSVGRYLTGNGPWYDIVFDAIGVLTLGTGSLAMKALSKGFPALKGAYASFQGSRAAAASLAGNAGDLRWATMYVSSRFRNTRLLAQRNFTAIHHAADLAEDAARTAASATPAMTGLQRFVLGGTENAGLVTHVRDISTKLDGLSNVPAELTAQAARIMPAVNTYVASATVSSVNGVANLVTGAIADPNSADTHLAGIQVWLDAFGRAG